ncbi:MAG: hypothetical protein Tsb0027_02280 [Wenzhouxiangellaceae bacterium]
MATNEKQLDDLRKQLDRIEQKTVSKQWFAIVMVAITASVTAISYTFEKHVDRQWAQSIAYQRVFGEKGAQETIEFLKNSGKRFSDFRSALTEYCNIQSDSVAKEKLIESAKSMTGILYGAYIERSLINSLELAIDTVIVDVTRVPAEISPPEVCRRSKSYVERASIALEARISPNT